MTEHGTVWTEIEFSKKRFAKNCKTNSVLFLNAIKPLSASKSEISSNRCNFRMFSSTPEGSHPIIDNQRTCCSLNTARKARDPSQGHKDMASDWESLARGGVILTHAFLGAPWCNLSLMNTPDKVNKHKREHFLSLFARVITAAVPKIIRQNLTDCLPASPFLFLPAKSTGKSKILVSCSNCVLLQL